MKAAVLADTGPLYALADTSDQYHARATAELEAIAKRSFAVAVSYVTLFEAQTLVLRRLGGAYSREWLAEVLNGTILLSPEPGDYLLAAAQLEQFPDHSITLVDALTVTMSRRLEVPVWTFDRHFYDDARPYLALIHLGLHRSKPSRQPSSAASAPVSRSRQTPRSSQPG